MERELIHYSPAKTRAFAGFSLLELLVVIAIMAMLIAFAIIGFGSMSRAQALATSGSRLADALKLAHQAALSGKRPVAFYLFTMKGSGGEKQVVGFQAFSVETAVGAGGTAKVQPLTKLEKFKESIIISENPKITTLLDNARKPVNGLEDYPNPANQIVDAHVFQFFPSGGTDLDPAQKWFATLVDERTDSPTEIPKNFVTLQIDPLSGGVMIHRP